VSRRQLALLLGLATAATIPLVTAAILAARDHSPTSATPRVGPYRGSTLPWKIPLPPFSLRDQDGTRISAQGLHGRVIVLTFLDTACHDSCPIIANVIGAAMPRLTASERPRVTAVALTVNPLVDTPPHVRRFLRNHRALGMLDFLLGSPRELRPVWHAFKILSALESGNPDIHSAPVRIYDPHSIWVSTLSAGIDLTAANLVHDIRVALRQ
jgi:cytochrome oxidase Cu insertion factor (SCO1/SenC/PrrC family)